MQSLNPEKVVNVSGVGNAVFQMTCNNFINLPPNELISVNFKNTSCFHRLSLSLSIDMKFPSGLMIVNFELPSGFDDDFVIKELPPFIMVIIS